MQGLQEQLEKLTKNIEKFRETRSDHADQELSQLYLEIGNFMTSMKILETDFHEIFSQALKEAKIVRISNELGFPE